MINKKSKNQNNKYMKYYEIKLLLRPKERVVFFNFRAS